MTIKAKDYKHLIGNLDGFSEGQLSQHFGLYEGYVKKWNEIQEKLAKADRSAANYSFGEFSELKRREAVAFNGAYLHELYFENLAKEGGKPSAALESAIAASFGSLGGLYDDLKASGASTPGWVLLTKSKTDGRLHTFVLYEHHVGLPVHQTVLLAMDCWEHAFMVDYGTKKADYLDAFIANIDWTAVEKRFSAAR